MSLPSGPTGRQYQYIFHHRSLTESIPVHLDRYFGPHCDPNMVQQLSDADRAGIRDGNIYAGMTKNGVILAAGYPPLHRTRLQSNVWRYWRSRMNTFEVYFVDGVVQYVRE